MPPLDKQTRHFLAWALIAGLATVAFLLWMIVAIGGPRLTDGVDDVGELVAALAAVFACCVAAVRVSSGRSCWVLLGASAFAWAAGEAAWTYYDLILGVQVPFLRSPTSGSSPPFPWPWPVSCSFPVLLNGPPTASWASSDGCIIAGSILFASWATVLGPLYDAHHGGVLKQILSLAYPASDVVMVSLVIILFARAGQRGRASLVLVMAGIVAFAVADSAFSYLTEVNNYGIGSFLDTAGSPGIS